MSAKLDRATADVLLDVRVLLAAIERGGVGQSYREIARLKSSFAELEALRDSVRKPCRSTGPDDKRRWCRTCRKRMGQHLPLAPIERSPDCVTPRCGS